MFVLLARDPMARHLVLLWAAAREQAATRQRDIDKADEAYGCAEAMEQWKADHPDH